MKSESHSVVSDSLQPEFSKPAYGSGQPFPSAGDLPNPGIEPWSPALQVDSLPAEPQGKPKNTGVGCHSLLQGIFPTQGLNPGLLHFRWILYQLSNKGSPILCMCVSHSVMSDSVISWTTACQAPLCMGFCRKEYWSGLPFPSPGDLPNPGIKPGSPALPADSLPSGLPGKPYKWGRERQRLFYC